MVVFTCQNCGESLQKPRVEKHYNTVCRRGPVNVSCVDCFKDFDAVTYVTHTKCITEEERYAAKGFQLKSNAHKGLQKQEKWIETIQRLLNDNPMLPKEQRQILSILVKHQNVPRKLAKFKNFMKNVCPRANEDAVTAVFELFDKEHKKTIAPPPATNGKIKPQVQKETETKQISNGNLKQNGTVNKSSTTKTEEFKWKPTILHYVKDKRQIKKKKLLEKVLAAYKSYHPELNEISDDIVQKYHIKLSKMKKVFVDNDFVKLRE